MTGKIKAAVALLVAGALVGGILVLRKSHSGPPVKVKLRLTVSPREQMDFVIGQAKSAKLKYDVGKLAGLKPILAQRVSIKPVPNSSLLEVQVGVETKEEGQRFIEAFVNLLKARCDKTAELAVVEQSIR